MSAAPQVSPGQPFGPYALLAKLATGGMGEIFVARRSGTAGFEKLVVIKRLLPHLAEDEHFVAMFLDEARLAASISHPNVCQVHELDQFNGQHYIAMEYLEGVTLSRILRRCRQEADPLDLRLVAGIMQQACEGLHHAHELHDAEGNPLGLVHRDVSPSNLFVTESGVVKVLDFGVAKSEQAMAKTRTGSVKGKYAYMSPEQITLKPLDRRSDVFALGIVLHEAVANRRLFARASEYFVLRAVTEDPIPPVDALRDDLPPGLAAAVSGALDRDPDARVGSARELGGAIAAAVAPLGGPIGHAGIAAYVQEHFGAELAERRSIVKVSLRAARVAAAERAGSQADATAELVDGLDNDTIEEATRFDRPGTSQGGSAARPLPWVWIAAAGIVLAGAALFVARGLQQSDGATSEPVIVYEGRVSPAGADDDELLVPSEPSPVTASADAAAVAAAPGAAPADAAVSEAPTRHRRDPDRKQPRDPYSVAFSRQQSRITDCFNRHALDVSGAPELAVRIQIAPSGTVAAASLSSPALEKTPLGTCILELTRAIRFPAQREPVTVSIPLKVRKRP